MKLCKMKQPDETFFLYKKEDGSYHQLGAGPTMFSAGIQCWMTDEQYEVVKSFVECVLKEVHDVKELN